MSESDTFPDDKIEDNRTLEGMDHDPVYKCDDCGKHPCECDAKHDDEDWV